MKKKFIKHLTGIVIILMAGLLMSGRVQAGSKVMEATKREVYQNNSTESMAEVNLRRETEEKEYRQKTLSNSEESIKLLKEIRDLLQELIEKEK